MLALNIKHAVQQVIGERADVLAQVLREQVNLAVWQRQLPVHITDCAANVVAHDRTLAESITLELSDADEQPDLTGLLARYSHLPGHEALVGDVRSLISAFVCLVDAKRIGVRMRVLDKAMCPRFHVDHVPLRLITCYAGLGSEWLSEDAMDRRLLGQPAAEPVDDGLINRAQTGHVLLAKGERWVGNEGQGLIHRSPQASNGVPRLLLTLDWLA
ncbi:conserved protein of unknown function [Pseudomonas marincola]|uniref:DUF1826 domain-containing protein n=1 Tax=Pseudomonas marincola TaxID=437900 RepID=A0A653E7I1_9PSED|nr:DUF1826 domain-containing protein [Pseudomonas marincola]CAE6914976.1 conserved protein of unknown function [Pseudomonas marincola]